MSAAPTATALNRMTVGELKDLAKEQGLDLPDKVLKKDLVQLVRSNSKAPGAEADEGDDVKEPSALEAASRKYAEMMTDAFGYMSPAATTSEFQAHYKSVSWIIIVEALAMLLLPFPKTSEEISRYDPYVDKLNSASFHQAVLHWSVFLIIIPLVTAAIIGDRNSGSAYSTLIFAMARYLVVYLELPVVATTFKFLPIKFFTASCGVMAVLSFWTHVSWVESPAMMDFDDESELLFDDDDEEISDEEDDDSE